MRCFRSVFPFSVRERSYSWSFTFSRPFPTATCHKVLHFTRPQLFPPLIITWPPHRPLYLPPVSSSPAVYIEMAPFPLVQPALLLTFVALESKHHLPETSRQQYAVHNRASSNVSVSRWTQQKHINTTRKCQSEFFYSAAEQRWLLEMMSLHYWTVYTITSWWQICLDYLQRRCCF